MSQMLKGKTCLITGASSGIGAAIACEFAKKGAKLILVSSPGSQDDLNKIEQKCKSEGSQSTQCCSCDLTDMDAIKSCMSGFTDVDVLVNNAGVFFQEQEDPLKGDVTEWKKMLSINTLAPMMLTQQVGSGMASKGEGVIINIGDVEGSHTGPRHPAYAATKHALRGWSLSCYELLRDKGIKVCLINPGNVSSTKMLEKSAKGEAGQGAIAPDDVAKACMFVFQVSKNCVPSEMELKAVKVGQSS